MDEPLSNPVTPRQRALEAILEHLPTGVFVAEAPSGNPILANKVVLDQLGRGLAPDLTKYELVEHYRAFLRGTDQAYPSQRTPLVRALQGEASVVDDMEICRPDGTRVLMQVNGAPVFDERGNVVLSVVCTQDITARRQAEEALRHEQDFLRNMLRVHERDRQLMAYEIHDGMIQYVTGAAWQLEALAEDPQLSAEARQRLLETVGHLRRAIGEGRRVLSGLRPPVLDEQGILVAIRYLVAEAERPGSLDIRFEPQVSFQRLDPLLEGTIFRIVQETLSNITKHSRATLARIRLIDRSDRLCLVIDDNGQGFDPSRTSKTGFGLQGIRKRAELLGGSAQVSSTPGKGTTIELNLPYLRAITSQPPT